MGTDAYQDVDPGINVIIFANTVQRITLLDKDVHSLRALRSSFFPLVDFCHEFASNCFSLEDSQGGVCISIKPVENCISCLHISVCCVFATLGSNDYICIMLYLGAILFQCEFLCINFKHL